MALKPGMRLAVSVQAWENPAGLVIVFGAGPVYLKSFSFNTKVRLNIGARVLLPYAGISSKIKSLAIESQYVF